MVAKITKSREEIEAQGYMDSMYDAHKEERRARRWDSEYECYVDPKAAIPTLDVWCRGLIEIRDYREKVKEEIYKVMYASLEKKKKKTVEEIVVESEKLVKQKKQSKKEDLKQKAEKATVPNAKVKIQSESSKMFDKSCHETDEQCKKCMETCKACTKKDENLRSRNIEITKIEKIFKEKCDEMFENEKFLKQRK
ncbi:hypothetical protein Hanom_Chr17g01564721 [Helianthus anomalus]